MAQGAHAAPLASSLSLAAPNNIRHTLRSRRRGSRDCDPAPSSSFTFRRRRRRRRPGPLLAATSGSCSILSGLVAAEDSSRALCACVRVPCACSRVGYNCLLF